MNQTQTRSLRKKVLSLILAVVMAVSLLPISAFASGDSKASTTASTDEFVRIFHLDCGRKYFSVSEIEGIIDQLAENHYTHLQLAFGNDGFRFLLDDMAVGKYTSDQVKTALTNGNKTYSSSKKADSSMLSETDMDAIITYAEKQGISIIPMLNTPGHMHVLVSAMSELSVGSSRTDSEMNLTDDAQVSFIKALQQKYINYFAKNGSKYYNLAADEYSFSALSNTEYTAFAKYVNDVAEMVKTAGMTPMAYNDGINYSGKTTDISFDTDILVCYWAQGTNYASVADLSKDFKIINNTDAWYYVLGNYLYDIWANGQWGYKDALNGIQNTPVTQAKNAADKEIPVVGSVLCCWCDGPAKSFSENKANVYNLIKAMADANPEYFTDEVKLPAADTSADVSVEVVGKKGETASVKAETITSAYTFDVENVVSYNVTPTIDGKAYSGSGTVTLPVPSGWEQNPSRIRAYIIDNGAVKMIRGTYSDGKYTFDVQHFSEMGLLQLAENAGNSEPVTITQGRTSQSYTLSGNNLPKDGEYKTEDGIVSYTIATTVADKTAKVASEIESGTTYIIGNGSQFLKRNGNSIGTTDKLEEATKWTITGSNGSYSIKTETGDNYLSYSSSRYGSVSLATSSRSTTWSWNNTDGFSCSVRNYGWPTTYYLTYSRNNWTLSSYSNDKDGSQPYTVVDVLGGTTVTFTGLKPDTTSVTLGDTTYNITVTEKQTVEIPISIIDYRADGLLFDFQVGGETYDYGLVHNYDDDGSKSSVNGGTLSGTSYGTRIAGTTLENTGYVAGDSYSGNYYLWGNKWSRSGMVESKLGSNGMPVYTNATVARVAQELAAGNYNSAEMAGVANSNDVIYNTFILSGKVVGSDDTEMSAAFSGRKSWDNINNAYDLAWYLLNTLYQADTNMTTVTDADGVSHTVPIYGMAVNAYDSIILTENNGVYTFDAANGKSHYDTASRSIYEDDSVESLQFYPIDGLGYDAILGDTTDKTDNSGKDTVVRPEHPNGSYTLRGEAQFVYQDDLYFEFSGDDDVYMYVNGTLALDLGGAHGICTKRVNLKDVAEKCNLTPGEVATFTFFYMERNSDASNFKIETNMELVKPGISVAKKAYDSGYANEIPNGSAVETDKSAYYDLIVTNQSNVAMNQISFADQDSREGTANFGYGVTNASVSTGTVNTNGTVSLKESGSYVIYVTDANETEVSGTRQTLTSLSALSKAVAAVTLQPNQSLHVRFLQAEFKIDNAKILNYENTVNVTATVGNQSLKARATHELYSYNAGDTSRTYVVDFGLPLKIEGIFDKDVKNSVGEVRLSSTNVLKYGTVDLTSAGYGTSLVYMRTADKTINDAETIVLDVTYLMGSNKVTLQKTLTIIPATTVYYEDSLATFTNADGTKNVAQSGDVDNGYWVTDGTTQTNVNQALEALGGTTNTKNVYGYDPAYANSSKFSMGSATKVTVDANTANNSQWPTATFTFKGTGFDVISLTDNNSGAISVKVYSVGNDGTETQVKGTLVNNYYGYTYEDGKWTANPTGDNNALYQIPVIKISGLDYGTYKVVITASYATFADKTGDGQYNFWLDAIRVYDPMGKDNATYEQDNEGYPQYIKLRDSLVGETATAKNGSVFIDGADKADIATYANYGPNNEVYLAKGQAISFKLTGALDSIASVQIGAKSPDGTDGAAVISVNGQKVTTATEMYYAITDTAKSGNQVTIANNGTGILSLTNLKITYTESGKSVSLDKLSAADQANAVEQVRALFAEPVEPFNPDLFTASWGHSVRKGDTATLTVKTSEDVEAIEVDGQMIDKYVTRTERTGWGWWAKTVTYREFTYTDTATVTKDYTVCAVNGKGISSDAITATLTVRPSVRDWLHGIIGKWF